MNLHLYFNPDDSAADLAPFAQSLDPVIRREINASPPAFPDRRVPTGAVIVVIDGEAL